MSLFKKGSRFKELLLEKEAEVKRRRLEDEKQQQEEKFDPDYFNEQELGDMADEYVESVVDVNVVKSTAKKSFSDYLLDYYPEQVPMSQRLWMRPTAPPLQDDFIFQHIDTTQSINVIEEIPIIRLFGVTAQGHSVMVSIDSFRPYFFASIASDVEAEYIRDKLEAMLKRDCKGKAKIKGRYILDVERVQRRSMCGWEHREQDEECGYMYKFTMCYPAHVKKARDSLEYANRTVTEKPIKTYEANVPFELRFMVDSKLSGCQWIRLRKGTYRRVEGMYANGSRDKLSTVQYHLHMSNGHDHNSIEPLDIKEHGDLAPMRILSFDLEAKRKGAGFVNAETDPVICICTELYIIGTGTVHRAAFVYVESKEHKVAHIEDVDHVFVYQCEEHMMLAFQQYICETDPDMFTGWNITGFDWPYLVKRSKALGIHDAFLSFSRIRGQTVWARETVFQSKAYGAKKSNELMCEGRFEYDGMIYLLRMVYKKYRSYGLNAIASEVLNDTKVDVHYSQIPILHEGTDEQRAHLVWYCVKDAKLPVELLEKLMSVVNGIEQSRVTGVPLKWLLTRGQGIKTFSNILRYKLAREVVPSRSPKLNNVYTVGGYVRDPIAGYYAYPLATLDFASLYPSIMQAYNICYSTVVLLAEAKRLIALGLYKEDDFNYPPIPGCDFCFVKAHIRKGVLPDMLDALLNQRRYVKKLMGTAQKGSLLASVLDSRQLALKVVCNSVYGFLKAFILIDPRLMTSVTSWGQEMIKATARLCEEHFKDRWIIDRAKCQELGLDFEKEPAAGEEDPRPRKQYSARIIYGDTDSVMVDFGDTTLQQILEFGEEAAQVCTKTFVAPNKLEFESVKLRSLFMKKKRYGSLEIEGAKRGMTIEEACKKAKIVPKGLESKRRDNAKIGSETQAQVLNLILRHGDIAGAQQVTEQAIASVLQGQVDMSKLIITKGLSKTDEQYEQGGTKQQHTTLKKKMEARSHITGEVVPQTGDRVPFVMISGARHDMACDLAEHPIYAQQHKLPIDTKYYIEKQIMAATLRIFTCVWEPSKINDIESSMTHEKRRKLIAYKRLFKPDLPHMRQKRLATTLHGIAEAGLDQATFKCAQPGCHVTVQPNDRSRIVCDYHQRVEAEVLLRKERDRADDVRIEAWQKCRDCAGGGFDEHNCSNMTCDNFFHRQTAITDVEDIDKMLTRFTLPDKETCNQPAVFVDATSNAKPRISIERDPAELEALREKLAKQAQRRAMGMRKRAEKLWLSTKRTRDDAQTKVVDETRPKSKLLKADGTKGDSILHYFQKK